MEPPPSIARYLLGTYSGTSSSGLVVGILMHFLLSLTSTEEVPIKKKKTVRVSDWDMGILDPTRENAQSKAEQS